jgi:hypothetical protein
VVKVLVPKIQDMLTKDYIEDHLNDPVRTQVFFGHYPHGASVRNLAHLGQIVANNQLQEYDHLDPIKN